MKIRNIDSTDLKSCARLYADVFSSEPWSEAWDEDIALARLTYFHESKGFIGVLAEDDGIVGFALGNTEPFYSGTLFYLREMCVRSGHQAQGIGSQVYSALEEELSSVSVGAIYLLTERGIPAAQFYIGKGFDDSEVMGFYSKQLGL